MLSRKEGKNVKYVVRSVVIGITFLVFTVAMSSCATRQPPTSTQQPPGQQVVPPHAVQPSTTAPVGPATVVPEGTTPEEFAAEYYEAYIAGDWAKAYEYLPAATKAREDLEAFKASRSTMPIGEYTVKAPVESIEGTATIITVPVELQLGGSGSGMTWISNWIFEKREDESIIIRETVTSVGQ